MLILSQTRGLLTRLSIKVPGQSGAILRYFKTYSSNKFGLEVRS